MVYQTFVLTFDEHESNNFLQIFLVQICLNQYCVRQNLSLIFPISQKLSYIGSMTKRFFFIFLNYLILYLYIFQLMTSQLIELILKLQSNQESGIPKNLGNLFHDIMILLDSTDSVAIKVFLKLISNDITLIIKNLFYSITYFI